MYFSTMNVSTIALLSGLFLASCTDDSSDGNRSSGTAHVHQASGEDRERGDTPPRMGMTKDQVLQLYGEPMNITTSRHGETWSYAFNNFDAHSLIPIYGGWHEAFKKRHSGSVTFNGSGRVIDYQWNQSNLRAGTIYH
jgi:outer membrane protein assembly factor BamE (lipoprotein component of BamABCDE complex)